MVNLKSISKESVQSYVGAGLQSSALAFYPESRAFCLHKLGHKDRTDVKKPAEAGSLRSRADRPGNRYRVN